MMTPLEAPDPEMASDTQEDAEPRNPFVPMHRRALWLLLALGAIYTLSVCSVAIYSVTEQGLSMAGVALSTAWLLFWVFFPLLRYRTSYGWCHPLVLLALLGIINIVPRSTGLFMHGLPEHVMLGDWSSSDLNWLYAYGNVVSSLALIAIYIGYFAGPRLPVPALSAPEHPKRRLYLLLFVALGMSAAAFYLYAQASGGFYNHVKSLAFGMARRIELAGDAEGFGQYTVVITTSTVAALVWVCAQPHAFRNPGFWLLGSSALVMAYLSEGKRSHMLYPAILIMLCWMLRNQKVPLFRLASLGVATFFLIGFLGLFRSSNWSDTEILDFSFVHQTSLLETGTDSLDEFARRSGSKSTYFPILAKVPAEEPLLYGKSYLEWGLRFLPRMLWPDKPRGVDVQANQIFYGADWGLPPGSVGEAYWNFHLPGVFAIFFLLGIFKRWLANLLIRYPDAPGVMVIYMISLFYFDPSQNGFKVWLYAIVPALTLLIFGGLLGRPARTHHAILSPATAPNAA